MSPQATETLFDERLAKTYAHPLRGRIFDALADGEKSPAALARELDEPLGNVAYHVRRLEALGMVELTRTETSTSTVQHFYRAIAPSIIEDHVWDRLPDAVRKAMSGGTLEKILHDAGEAVRRGAFNATRSHMSRVTLQLDDQAYAELSDLLIETVNRAMDIHAESIGRRTLDDDAPPEHITELAMLHYHREPAPE